jgi:hypothetical protein
MDAWRGLVPVAEAVAAGSEPWQRAEWFLLEQAFRERLSALGLAPGAESAVTLIAAALFLAEHVAEFDGDARDALAELTQLGLALAAEPAGQ